MKKVMLTAIISVLTTMPAFAGVSEGEIGMGGDAQNEPCLVTFFGAGPNHAVSFGSISQDNFGPLAPEGRITNTTKTFTLKATGYECNKASLRLALGNDTKEVTDGLFLAKGTNSSNTTTLPIALINLASNNPAFTSGSYPEDPSRQVIGATDTASYTEYDYESYVVNLGSIPAADSYKAQVRYRVVN